MNENFKAYQIQKNEDGTICVKDVEIFELGKHKGFAYDESWAQRALRNHENLSKGGFFPAAIIGHNSDKEEKPAKGRLANFRLEGKFIKADIDKVHPETYESLKKGEYPHRSVEVNPEEARFTALALLGGTSPYHKLPNLELFGGDEDAVRILFREEPGENPAHSLMQKFDELISKMKSIFENNSGGSTPPAKKPDKEGTTMPDVKLSEEQKMQFNEEFKEKYGMTPEEAAENHKKFQEAEKRRREDDRKARIAAFTERLKKEYKVAPNLVDDRIVPFLQALPVDDVTVKFSEGDEKPVLDAFAEVVENMVKDAKEDKLFFNDGEEVTGIEYEQFENRENVNKLHDKARKMAQEAVASGKAKNFHDAYSAAIFSLAEGTAQ